jgi:hypothetical protein
MRQLPEEFQGRGSQKGWNFKLRERSGKYAIYEKRSESNIYYEVIAVRVQKAMQAKYPNGTVVDYPEREVYPRDEEFGTYGWSYGSLDESYKKFALLVYNVPDILLESNV